MDRLRQKLEQYAPPPPPGAWALIEEHLSGNADERLRNQLLALEVTPPAQVWSALNSQLSGQTMQQPVTKIVYMRWLRVAVAVILFLAGGWWVAQYVSNRNDNTTAKTEQSAPKDDNNANTAAIISDTSRQENQTSVKQSVPNKNTRYVTVAKGGKTVRRSKKLQPLFDCAQLQEPGAVADCRKNLLDLQRKMASSTVNPTGDFAGLLDAIKTLEDNR